LLLLHKDKDDDDVPVLANVDHEDAKGDVDVRPDDDDFEE